MISADAVTLQWTTVNEVNNYAFYVQRSADAKTFTTLPGSFQAGHGTTIEHHDYSYTDATAAGKRYYYRLQQIDRDGTTTYSEAKKAEGTTDVKEQEPGEFALQQNYPNPFNPSTKIQFSIVNRQLTIVKVFDVLGRELATLVNEVKEPGTYTVQFNASSLASGVYFYRLSAGPYVECRKMIVMK